MKKTKLLTSLAALALVVSLGACEVNADVGESTDEDTSEEETTSESTTEEDTKEDTSEDNTSESTSEDSTTEDSSEDNTSSVEPPVTSIAELTFEVTLYVNGVADSCPDYGALYYLGGFNGYIDEFGWSCNGDYVKLEETTNSKGEVAYSYTFTDVPVADDHEWNIVFYYDDEEVGASGSFSTHALVKYQNIEVKSDTVSGSTIEVSADLSTSIAEQFPDPNANEESDADIISAILGACEDGLDWTAFHGEYTDESQDEYTEAYLTTDSNGNLYGSVLEYEDDELFWEYYYVDGVEYSHGLTYDNYFTEDDSDDFEYESFEDALDEFGCGFESFPYLSYEDRTDWILEVDDNIYTLTIPGTYSDSVTCSRDEDTYTILSVNETYEGTYPFYAGEVSFAESTSKETVDNALLGFDATLWGEGETTIADAISEFEDRGSDYNYGDGFSYQSIDYSASYYYNTECVATSDDNGYYIAESSWDETYYAYGAYSNGSNTWSYDSDDGCEDVGYLYFSYTLFTLQTLMSFAYTDFDEIIEGLTSFVGNDLDTDVLVTDELIYVWTSNEDEEQAVLYAEYEDNALSSLVYEYAGLTSARAVMLTPYEGAIDVPEWVEIDEGGDENQGETYEGDPVADLLADIKTNNNYTLTIEYTDWTSPTYGSEDEMYQDFYNGTISQNSQRLYDVDITFTEDVMFIEYYYGTNAGSVYDIESYINNGDDMEVWWCTDSYSTTLAQQTSMKETNQSWQNKWKSETLLGLDDSLFSVDTSSYDGSKVDYTVNIDSYTTLTSLVDCLYHCANYYAEGNYANNITPFIYNLETYWNTYGAPYVDSTYYFATGEWVTSTYYLEESVTPTGSGNDYQLKYHGVTAYVSNVGSTQLADIYASQLPIYSN